MTDQEKLPAQHTLVQTGQRSTAKSTTIIESVTDGDGKPIEDGGFAENRNLSIIGSAAPDQKAQLLDYGEPAHPPVYVDRSGHYSLIAPDQKNGVHLYTVKTTDEQVSASYTVHVVAPQDASISWISNSNGDVIENGDSTTSVDLKFEGSGESNSKVTLKDKGVTVGILNVLEGGWSAALTGLQPGEHEFTVVGSTGVESKPWIVVIVGSVTLTIQFLLGESGQLIGNQEQTTDTSLTVVGTANRSEKGKIVDYDNNLVEFVTDPNGIFTAKISNLAQKVHTIRAITDDGRISAPRVFRVVKA
ncbi:hypothetical protein [Pseudomonas sp. GW456-12-1-14-TSB6]|uniref:hypothetical protein n=1 Tax=Pseudomonas sp. GW456-12-1-14-TSB6 TaxID=2751350 RepID=UPI000CD2D316|nr:hypothetical protein [Pseudomonas sp. GW456-12-1-14-TSB6]POA35286.1 hypothetical protein C1891_18635 [Pseudomonas sp. GW456-12-1-14-TSB6]